jgi:hypothetical protein
METWLLPVGLGGSVAGAVVLALADAWLSRSILVYLDAVEANVHRLAAAVRSGSTEFNVTGIDLKRDRRQNSARALKMVGWLILAAGLALQFGASYLAVAPARSASVAAQK